MPEPQPEPALFTQALAAARISDATAPFASLASSLAAAPSDDVKALVLAAHMGRALTATEGAFWFRQREARFQWALGFPRALVVVDPAPLVDAALNDLASLDARVAELRASLALHVHVHVNSGVDDGALDAKRYAALFDPDMIAPLVLDRAKVDGALATPTAALVDRVRAALARTTLDPMEREMIDDALLAPLTSSDAIRSRARAHAMEHVVAICAAVRVGAAAEEGFWADVVLRLPGVERPAGARMLGVFRVDAVAPVVADADADAPRLLAVDARDLVVTLSTKSARDLSTKSARGDLIDVARARLDELHTLATMAADSGGARVLALHRHSVSHAAKAHALGVLGGAQP